MRAWIDLSNSPHALLFAPVARRLEALGASVNITARDNAQTVELARRYWDRVEVIGNESPPGRAAKAAAIAARAGALARWALRARPDVALSHNSYSQLIAARMLAIPSVTAMDYEHQAANHVAFRAADRILLPEAIPGAVVRRQGAASRKVVRYDGYKEELYLGDFAPDPGVVAALGIGSADDTKLVVARTPPSRASYHGFENPLFYACLRTVAAQDDVRCVVLVRHDEQRQQLEQIGLGNVTIPRRAIDARSLIYLADLMIGAGGTMTREAALMGVPTYSVFAGRPAAVDEQLIRKGLLRRLTSPAQVASVVKRSPSAAGLEHLRERGRDLDQLFVEAVLTTARSRS